MASSANASDAIGFGIIVGFLASTVRHIEAAALCIAESSVDAFLADLAGRRFGVPIDT